MDTHIHAHIASAQTRVYLYIDIYEEKGIYMYLYAVENVYRYRKNIGGRSFQHVSDPLVDTLYVCMYDVVCIDGSVY